MNKLSIKDINCQGKRVLVRVDFNVPLDGRGQVTDDIRVREALPTIQKILADGGRAILMSHLGRPKGKVVESMRLTPAAQCLSRLLGREVHMAPDCVGPEVEKRVAALADGECLMLDNLRFHSEEEANDPAFAKKLAALGDLYVNDAFGSAHRAHASTEGVTHFFRENLSGFLMEKEINYLGSTLANPKRPFVAIIGGAKISGKIEVIDNLLGKVDTLLIGGGMAFTFFKAQGLEIGGSLLEADKVELAKSLLAKAGAKLVLPLDAVIAPEISETAPTRTVSAREIPAGWKGLDIGPQTVALFAGKIQAAKTVAWNGPLGVFETKPFAQGTNQVAQALADATAKGTVSVIGGGDTAAAVAEAGLDKKMSHVSTGGGASLEMMEGKLLPGVAALTDKR